MVRIWPCNLLRCFGDLKTMTYIAYIAYIIVLISVQAMATWPRNTMMQGILITIATHRPHCPHCKFRVRFVSCQDLVRNRIGSRGEG
jgi:hypothetical protein